MDNVILTTDLPLPKKSGKVRDIYDLDNRLLIVTTDRISAFDRVFPTGIPCKGDVLNRLSAFWFDQLYNIDNHFLSCDIDEIATYVPSQVAHELLQGNKYRYRTMLVEKYNTLPVECIVRGFLTGSAWKEYKETGYVSGVKLPAGMKFNAPLPEPLFTPSTKESEGHDINITLDQMIDLLGKAGFDEALCMDVVEESIEVYKQAAIHAFNAGIIVADTKFEWGYYKAKSDFVPVLIDEVVTPDSSRLWAVEKYRLDDSIDSLDKQYVRDYLINSGTWNSPEPPVLPDDVVLKTSEKYQEVYKQLTQKDLYA